MTPTYLMLLADNKFKNLRLKGNVMQLLRVKKISWPYTRRYRTPRKGPEEEIITEISLITRGRRVKIPGIIQPE